MTDYLHDFKRPRRMKSHESMVFLDRWEKQAYRNGTLVRPKKGRKRRRQI